MTPLERYIAKYATNISIQQIAWRKGKPRWGVGLSPLGIRWYVGRGTTIDSAFQKARVLMEKAYGIQNPKRMFP